ncbi:MAG: hypothetical protein M1312_02005 [Patescibacteria group bacterium]|nr:hypothetical protein [Patescibacteria group bacterium]
MWVYKQLIRPIIVVLLLSAAPIILLIYLGLSNAALPILIYFQLLLIYIQSEISLRQNNLFSAQFYPFFTIEISNPLTYELKIKNISKNPAYQLFVGRVLKYGLPVSLAERDSLLENNVIMSSLAPDESKIIKPFKSMEAIDKFRGGLAMELTYNDQFGNTKALSLLFSANNVVFLVPNMDEKPGPLLRELERATVVRKLWKYRKQKPVG